MFGNIAHALDGCLISSNGFLDKLTGILVDDRLEISIHVINTKSEWINDVGYKKYRRLT